MTAFTFTAYPGQKVVCINARWHQDWPCNLLVQNVVYTVAAVADTGGLFLVESPWIAPYKRSRFRPVQTTRTDAGVSALRSILDNPETFVPTATPADEPTEAPPAVPVEEEVT